MPDSPAWPERIDCGQGGVTYQNAHKAGFLESRIRPRFWPGTEPVKKCSGQDCMPVSPPMISRLQVGRGNNVPKITFHESVIDARRRERDRVDIVADYNSWSSPRNMTNSPGAPAARPGGQRTQRLRSGPCR